MPEHSQEHPEAETAPEAPASAPTRNTQFGPVAVALVALLAGVAAFFLSRMIPM
jgi:hypothetical protein